MKASCFDIRSLAYLPGRRALSGSAGNCSPWRGLGLQSYRAFPSKARGRKPSLRWTGRSRTLSSPVRRPTRSEEHTSELQSRPHLVCRLLLEKKKKKKNKKNTKKKMTY